LKLLSYSPPVPPPSVLISGLSASPVYSGTSLLLSCIAQVDGAVDTNVMVTAVWRRGGELLTSNNRRNITSVTFMRSSTYETTITVSPPSSILDGGHYSCEFLVRPYPASSYILRAQGTDLVLVNIEGEFSGVDCIKIMFCMQAL